MLAALNLGCPEQLDGLQDGRSPNLSRCETNLEAGISAVVVPTISTVTAKHLESPAVADPAVVDKSFEASQLRGCAASHVT